jgi:flavin reductase (DIM6/NTAB) family NADH-FMN oxidoreductase RutF
MGKQNVAFSDYIKETYRTMERDGILLVSQAHSGKPNAMAIGWGTIGIVWGKPMFVVLVRPSRYTYGCIEKVPEFTVNVPTPDMKEAVSFCGTRSGRDIDKFARMGFTALPSAEVSPPLIGECAIHYECRVVHRNDVQPDELARQIITGCYAQGDFHRVYFGEILRTYVDRKKLRSLKV